MLSPQVEPNKKRDSVLTQKKEKKERDSVFVSMRKAQYRLIIISSGNVMMSYSYSSIEFKRIKTHEQQVWLLTDHLFIFILKEERTVPCTYYRINSVYLITVLFLETNLQVCIYIITES